MKIRANSNKVSEVLFLKNKIKKVIIGTLLAATLITGSFVSSVQEKQQTASADYHESFDKTADPGGGRT